MRKKLRPLYVLGCIALCHTSYATNSLFAKGPYTTPRMLHVNATKADFKVSGKVVSEDGEELPGVNILLKGSTSGTVTEIDGSFTLNVPDGNGTLIFSFVGYNRQEIAINGRQFIEVKLTPDLKALEEVVVVGYGTMKKSDVTGAITSVKTKDLTAIPSTNALRTLQGKVAGIDITQSSGQPGAGINIVLRGNRSLRADNNPLVLVDGIPYGSFVDINPTDIESVEILKDVASTAIYGTRGANGVIMITTKRGATGKSKLSVNSYVSMNSKALYPRMMNGEEYAQLKREAYRTTNNNVYRNDQDIFQVEEYQYIQDKQFENWQDYIFHKGLLQNYEVSLTGGNEKTMFAISGGFQRDKGLLKNDVFGRINGKVSVDHKINNTFKVGVNAMYTYKNQDKRDNPLNMANKILPIAKAFDDDGKLILNPAPGYSAQFNPLADEQPDVFVNNILDKRLFTSAYLDINLAKDLFFKSTIGLDIVDYRRGFYKGYNSIANVGRNSNSGVELNNRFNYTWENILTYRKSFGAMHDLTAMVGTSSLGTKLEEYNASGNNQASPITSYHDINSNTISKAIGSRLRETRIASFFGRVNYKLLDRYIFQASLRADGSSVLAAGNQWGYFPSVSGAWRVIEEDFLRDNNLFNDLKFRVSWGKSGNAAIDPYATKGGLATSVYAFGTTAAFGYWPSGIPNPNLTWETTGTWNAGIDFGILGNRIAGSIEVYRSRTSDLLLPSLLPPATGYTQVMENIGQTENKGVEITINTQNITKAKFRWSSDLSFTLNREKILALNSGVTRNEANSWFVGDPTRVFYDYKKIGIWQLGEEEAAKAFGGFKPGDIKVADTNGNGVHDPGDRITFSQVPKFSAGFNNHFEYGNFDLSVFVFARVGQFINYEPYTAYKPSALENSSNVDYWTPENPTNAFPRPNSSYSTTNYLFQSTLGYVDGSFLKIRDVSLGYNLPKTITQKLGVGRVRVYSTLQNYFTFSKLKDYDPERGGALSFPLVKQMIFGVNLDF